MDSNEFKMIVTLPASPEEIFDAWLSSEGHSRMTGSRAEVRKRLGGQFSAWDGYIWGVTIEMERPGRIVQAWRTSEFSKGDPDSQVEITLEKSKGGTKLSLRHSNIPEGQAENYKQGWKDFYFKPMKEYFKKK
ncbi:MAG: SRPBCC domain-containing protein [Chloroflexota bacterium]